MAVFTWSVLRCEFRECKRMQFPSPFAGDLLNSYESFIISNFTITPKGGNSDVLEENSLCIMR